MTGGGFPVSRFPGGAVRGAAPHHAKAQAPALRRRATGQPGNHRILRIVGLAVVTMLVAQAASACPVCYGDPNDPMVKGTNNGVWVLLGIIGFVQIGFVAMFWSFWRRARDQKRFRDQFHVIEGGPHS
ncbi:MAG TPA: hypothetical protein VNA69_05140 [Thermoanaerobaculia bacterium]|nr:hypothetical protein [Thermoanaerobaculia bacterium]